MLASSCCEQVHNRKTRCAGPTSECLYCHHYIPTTTLDPSPLLRCPALHQMQARSSHQVTMRTYDMIIAQCLCFAQRVFCQVFLRRCNCPIEHGSVNNATSMPLMLERGGMLTTWLRPPQTGFNEVRYGRLYNHDSSPSDT